MDEKVYPGFLRQRRNLILITVAVAFIEAAGLTATGEINIFGSVFEMERPWFFGVFVWAALIYMLVRYLQYFHDLRDKGIRQKITDKSLEYARVSVTDKLFSDPDYENIGVEDYKEVYEERKLAAINVGVSFRYKGDAKTSEIIEFMGYKLFLLRARAFLYVTFKSHLVTEFILPLVLVGILIIGKLVWGMK